MVPGLEKFKEYFRDYTNQYVFIGGTAGACRNWSAGYDSYAWSDVKGGVYE